MAENMSMEDLQAEIKKTTEFMAYVEQRFEQLDQLHSHIKSLANRSTISTSGWGTQRRPVLRLLPLLPLGSALHFSQQPQPQQTPLFHQPVSAGFYFNLPLRRHKLRWFRMHNRLLRWLRIEMVPMPPHNSGINEIQRRLVFDPGPYALVLYLRQSGLECGSQIGHIQQRRGTYSTKNIIDPVNLIKLGSHQAYHHGSDNSLEFQVFFIDHAGHDFNTLLKSLPKDKQYYTSAIPGSFHGRLFPESSIHVFHSQCARRLFPTLASMCCSVVSMPFHNHHLEDSMANTNDFHGPHQLVDFNRDFFWITSFTFCVRNIVIELKQGNHYGFSFGECLLVAELNEVNCVDMETLSHQHIMGIITSLFDKNGKLLGSSRSPIQRWTDGALIEQSSTDIWHAICASIKAASSSAKVAPEEVQGMGFAATCSLVAVDADGSPVSVSWSGDSRRNIVVGMDHRVAEQAERLNSLNLPELQYCGGALSPKMELLQLLWVKEKLSESWSMVFMWMDLSAWLSYKATGDNTHILYTTACKWTYVGHVLMQHINDKDSRDMEAYGWDDESQEEMRLGDLIKELHAKIGRSVAFPGHALGSGLTLTAAKELGLVAGFPVGTSLINAHAGGVGVMESVPQSDYAAKRHDGEEICNRMVLVCGTSTCHMAVLQRKLFMVVGPDQFPFNPFVVGCAHVSTVTNRPHPTAPTRFSWLYLMWVCWNGLDPPIDSILVACHDQFSNVDLEDKVHFNGGGIVMDLPREAHKQEAQQRKSFHSKKSWKLLEIEEAYGI